MTRTNACFLRRTVIRISRGSCDWQILSSKMVVPKQELRGDRTFDETGQVQLVRHILIPYRKGLWDTLSIIMKLDEVSGLAAVSPSFSLMYSLTAPASVWAGSYHRGRYESIAISSPTE